MLVRLGMLGGQATERFAHGLRRNLGGIVFRGIHPQRRRNNHFHCHIFSVMHFINFCKRCFRSNCRATKDRHSEPAAAGEESLFASTRTLPISIFSREYASRSSFSRHEVICASVPLITLTMM